MTLTRSQVEHVAKLARLQISESEAEALTGQLSRILQHVASMNRLDTEAVEPTYHAIDLKNVLREDQPQQSLDRDRVLKQAQDAENGCFKVPKITEG